MSDDETRPTPVTGVPWIWDPERKKEIFQSLGTRNPLHYTNLVRTLELSKVTWYAPGYRSLIESFSNDEPGFVCVSEEVVEENLRILYDVFEPANRKTYAYMDLVDFMYGILWKCQEVPDSGVSHIKEKCFYLAYLRQRLLDMSFQTTKTARRFWREIFKDPPSVMPKPRLRDYLPYKAWLRRGGSTIKFAPLSTKTTSACGTVVDTPSASPSASDALNQAITASQGFLRNQSLCLTVEREADGDPTGGQPQGEKKPDWEKIPVSTKKGSQTEEKKVGQCPADADKNWRDKDPKKSIPLIATGCWLDSDDDCLLSPDSPWMDSLKEKRPVQSPSPQKSRWVNTLNGEQKDPQASSIGVPIRRGRSIYVHKHRVYRDCSVPSTCPYCRDVYCECGFQACLMLYGYAPRTFGNHQVPRPPSPYKHLTNFPSLCSLSGVSTFLRGSYLLAKGYRPLLHHIEGIQRSCLLPYRWRGMYGLERGYDHDEAIKRMKTMDQFYQIDWFHYLFDLKHDMLCGYIHYGGHPFSFDKVMITTEPVKVLKMVRRKDSWRVADELMCYIGITQRGVMLRLFEKEYRHFIPTNLPLSAIPDLPISASIPNLR